MAINTTLGYLVLARDHKSLALLGEIIPPGAYKFQVAKLLDAVDAELKVFERQRLELFKKYGLPERTMIEGKLVETGNLTMVGAPFDNLQLFNTAMTDLLDLKIVLPHNPITWSLLGSVAQEKLTVNDVRYLGPLLAE